MYEDKTVDSIQTDLLNTISDDYEKSVGTLVYDLTKSFAIQENLIYQALDVLLNKVDIDKLNGDDLTKYVYQRKGIVRKPATKAIGTLNIIGTGTISSGTLFETHYGIQFRATETVIIDSTGTVPIEAINPGTIGNVGANSITLMPVQIQGITGVINPQATYDGFEAESDVGLRERYYEAIRKPPTSGNKFHYVSWAKEITGVGDARVYPLWNGDNTAKVVIIDSNKEPASVELVSQVQTYIDPNSSGTGEGQAPIGAYCTVVSATGKVIDLAFTATLEPGYTIETVQPVIEANITNYLRSIAFKADLVSHALVGANIINSDGLLDYANLTINGGTANILISDDETPVLGTVTIV